MKSYTIVGGGPTGLTLAWILSGRGHSVTILEAYDSIGGCHAVQRVDGAFAEHGPRVYTSSSVTLKKLLREMGTTFEDIFTPHSIIWSKIIDTQTLSIAPGNKPSKGILNIASWYELLAIIRTYLLFSIGVDYTRTSLDKFMKDNEFSSETYNMISNIAMLTDGSDATNYSVNKFMQLPNQEGLYRLYTPKRANDNGLFRIWRSALESRGVIIKCNVDVKTVTVLNGRVTGVVINDTNRQDNLLKSDNVILAIPPLSLLKILRASNLENAFGPNITDWVHHNNYYLTYSITFNWKRDLNLPYVSGLQTTRHQLAHIIISKYFKDDDERYKTIISTILMEVDGFSKKTDDEIKAIALSELRETYPTLPMPDIAIIGSRPYEYPAYIRGVKYPDAMKSISDIAGLCTVGPHINTQGYAFTSIESAIVSAYKFTDESYTTGWTLNWVILLLFIFVIFVAYILLEINKPEKIPTVLLPTVLLPTVLLPTVLLPTVL